MNHNLIPLPQYHCAPLQCQRRCFWFDWIGEMEHLIWNNNFDYIQRLFNYVLFYNMLRTVEYCAITWNNITEFVFPILIIQLGQVGGSSVNNRNV